ncbi:MAG: carboxypeptidase regulatory-like domain-containing protein, partial [Vicinamibacteria bacterium]|nr:carboxypeptidase regulatory-like domain-containing protein [Vicinamibacteria bacterium]
MRFRIFGWTGALLFAALTAHAQSNPSGTISGRVIDQQGLAVSGVAVLVQSPALQGTRTAQTSANGDFIMALLPPGDYDLSFSKAGFATLRRSIRLVPGSSIPINATLTVSQVSETITVEGTSATEFSQTAEVASSFKKDFLEKLPVARNFQQAALMTPGVQDSGPSGNMTISGAASFENLFMVNGVVVQDNLRNTPLNLFIEDALQETTTNTAAISAEYGRFSGGVVNAITKSGGNTLSGSFRTTFDNDHWSAVTNYPNDKRLDKIIPTYEATLGGPVLKDKLWFFGAMRLRTFSENRTTSYTNINFERSTPEKRF